MGATGILGNVNDGWFAQLAHGAEWVGRRIFGNGVYDNMEMAGNDHVTTLNQNSINQALAHGASQQQALQAGSAALEPLVNPHDVAEIGNLFGAGFSIALTAVKKTLTPVSPDILGTLMPLLIGAGVLGGAYLLTDNVSKKSRTKKDLPIIFR